MQKPTYQAYKKIFEGQDFPYAFVDLDLLDANINAIKHRVGSKKIRVATKSIRSRGILQYILDSSSIFQGLMTFTGKEALTLIDNGFDDILMGYPITNPKFIEGFCKATQNGKSAVLMVDSIAHFELIENQAKKLDVIQPVCIDLDMSSDYLGLHFGVYRSPINTVAKFKDLVDAVLKFKHVKIVGLMGYEAQIAGVGDASPYNGMKNKAIKILKKLSIPEIQKRRTACVEYLIEKGLKPVLINGGGTGSIDSTKKEEFVTEITVGSGFYSPGLFDYYENFKFQPAAAYAIEIVRKPGKDIYTAHGGGYTASGSVSLDKQPKPYLPEGFILTENEGVGEVQTPFVYKGKEQINIGDPVFMRHSKAGELCERFDTLLLVRGDKIEKSIPTYRGESWTFL